MVVNTAVALADMKINVGLLDADVFGPSIPLMMDLNESPLLTDGKCICIPKFLFNEIIIF